MFEKLLALIFPSRPSIAAIEAMRPAHFGACATRTLDELPGGLHSLFHYKDPLVRQALWALKYEGSRRVASLFAALLYESMVEIISEASLYDNFTEPLLVPIPLSQQRYLERGWNQSELLCKEIMKLSPQWHCDKTILKKVRHTLPQTKLSRKERLGNLKGCFEIDTDKTAFIRNRNIILIDDVTTTGSTLAEARRTLLKAGARHVLAFAVAH